MACDTCTCSSKDRINKWYVIIQIDRCASDEIYDAENDTNTQCCSNDGCQFMFIDYIKEHLNIQTGKGTNI